MSLPKRFALSTLLLVMLLASLACGLVQWRRLQIIGEFDELTAMSLRPPEMGAFESISPIFRQDGWWPKVGTSGVEIYIVINQPRLYKSPVPSGNVVTIGSDKYSVSEAKAFIAELSRRLKRIGIEQVRLAYEGPYYSRNVASELEEAVK